MRKLLTLALAVCALAVTLAARAEVGAPRLFGDFNMEPGAWSEYDVLDKKTGERSTMRMNVLTKEGLDVWYEVWINNKEGMNTIKMLVAGNPNNSDNVKRIILQSGGEPPMEIPRDFMVMGRRMASFMYTSISGLPTDKETLAKIREEKGETRTMEAAGGKFTGDLMKVLGPDSKLIATYLAVASVKPFGVVWSDSETSEMKLRDHGVKAKSRIKGNIRKMSKPPRRPPATPQGVPAQPPNGVIPAAPEGATPEPPAQKP